MGNQKNKKNQEAAEENETLFSNFLRQEKERQEGKITYDDGEMRCWYSVGNKGEMIQEMS
jgi:hypothetical protein